MATQLRAVETAYAASIDEITNGLIAYHRRIMDALDEAETVDFSFDADLKLRVTLKTSKREDREVIMFKLRQNMIPGLHFVDVMEGVETGARRRLTVTARITS